MPVRPGHRSGLKNLAVAPAGAGRPVGAIGVYWAALHTATASEIAVLQDLCALTATALARVTSAQV